MEIHRSDFDHDFIFGAATAAYQIEGGVTEGGLGPSSWDFLTKEHPGKVKNGQSGNIACDSYHLYKEDVKLLKNMGLDSYRFSISWTRVLPGGRLNAGVNKEGIEYYNDLINELIANGIQPFVTLHHFEVPQALEEEYGGFLSEKIKKDYCEFAELCFWNFGDRVKYWTTFNEPWSFIYYGYVMGTMPPCRGSSSAEHQQHPVIPNKCSYHDDCSHICESGNPGEEPYTASRNLLLAHAQAVHIYKNNFQPAQGGKIGITLNTHWFEPYSNSDADRLAADRALDFKFGWFMHPVTFGHYPKSMTDKVPPERLQRFSTAEAELLKGSYDFIGINYYTARYTKNYPVTVWPPSHLTDSETENTATGPDGKTTIGEQTAPSSWIYSYPEGIYKLLRHIKAYYNDPPIYITENGAAESNDFEKTFCDAVVDETRIKYLQEHLREIKRAIAERVDVKGYFVWSLLDNFEWAAGFNDRFGLIFVDFRENQLPRYPKSSALWFMNFLKRPIEYAKISLLPKKELPPSSIGGSGGLLIMPAKGPSSDGSQDSSLVLRETTTPIKRARAN